MIGFYILKAILKFEKMKHLKHNGSTSRLFVLCDGYGYYLFFLLKSKS